MSEKPKNIVRNTAAEARTEAGALGFLAEALFGGTSGAIEASEARGQRELVKSDVLPMEVLHVEGLNRHDEQAVRDFYGRMGIKVIGPVEGDGLFLAVELPPGWKKQATDHSMWSELLDDRGRERAAIFYKAAFYDRSAHFSPNRRYACVRDFVCGNGERAEPTEYVVVLKDGGTVIEEVGRCAYREFAAGDALVRQGEAILAERFPDYKNPLAYWD